MVSTLFIFQSSDPPDDKAVDIGLMLLIIFHLKTALTFFERNKFALITMRYRDIFINIRTPIKGEIKDEISELRQK